MRIFPKFYYVQIRKASSTEMIGDHRIYSRLKGTSLRYFKIKLEGGGFNRFFKKIIMMLKLFKIIVFAKVMVPPRCILNRGTVPPWFILNGETVPPFNLFQYFILNSDISSIIKLIDLKMPYFTIIYTFIL